MHVDHDVEAGHEHAPVPPKDLAHAALDAIPEHGRTDAPGHGDPQPGRLCARRHTEQRERAASGAPTRRVYRLELPRRRQAARARECLLGSAQLRARAASAPSGASGRAQFCLRGCACGRGSHGSCCACGYWAERSASFGFAVSPCRAKARHVRGVKLTCQDSVTLARRCVGPIPPINVLTSLQQTSAWGLPLSTLCVSLRVACRGRVSFTRLTFSGFGSGGTCLTSRWPRAAYHAAGIEVRDFDRSCLHNPRPSARRLIRKPQQLRQLAGNVFIHTCGKPVGL